MCMFTMHPRVCVCNCKQSGIASGADDEETESDDGDGDGDGDWLPAISGGGGVRPMVGLHSEAKKRLANDESET